MDDAFDRHRGVAAQLPPHILSDLPQRFHRVSGRAVFARSRIVSNCSFVSFITDSLGFFSKGMSSSVASLLICSSVTGGSIGLTGVSSTADQSPSAAVGSRKASLVTFASPTTALPLTL